MRYGGIGRFKPREMKKSQLIRCEEIRQKCEELERLIELSVDVNSSEKSNALVKLEECCFWAVRAISLVPEYYS